MTDDAGPSPRGSTGEEEEDDDDRNARQVGSGGSIAVGWRCKRPPRMDAPSSWS